ncbi:DUF1858 domain-containing protein, partial [Bacillus thuringiensis]|nr:DUF1858 domain-containing protein [Bacillus thuringiensis]
ALYLKEKNNSYLCFCCYNNIPVALIMIKNRCNSKRNLKDSDSEDKMKNDYINGKTLIGEIVNEHPEAIEVLMDCGMHCL